MFYCVINVSSEITYLYLRSFYQGHVFHFLNVGGWVHMSFAYRILKRALHLEIQVYKSLQLPVWVLGFQHRSSERAVYAFNC